MNALGPVRGSTRQAVACRRGEVVVSSFIAYASDYLAGCRIIDMSDPGDPVWVGSLLNKRVRWHLRHKPEVISGLLSVFLRAGKTTLRQRSPGAPAGARFGAVAFVHRFGSYLNSHIHFHVLVSDGVFSAGADGDAVFHPALDLAPSDFAAVQAKMRQRGLRWLHRHGHLDDDALHVLDSLDHAGGWSVDASVTIPRWDRQGLERLVRYCARPPLSQERLGRLNEQTLDLLAQLVTPPRLHKHWYCGVLAPNAALRQAVTASAGQAGATLLLLKQARRQMSLPEPQAPPPPTDPEPPSPLETVRRAASRCWALLLVWIYECLPLRCPKCGAPMRIIAFVLDRPQVERILEHIGERAQPPVVLPARSLPQLRSGSTRGRRAGTGRSWIRRRVSRRATGSDPPDSRTGAGRGTAAWRMGMCPQRGETDGRAGQRGGWIDLRGGGGGCSRSVGWLRKGATAGNRGFVFLSVMVVVGPLAVGQAHC